MQPFLSLSRNRSKTGNSWIDRPDAKEGLHGRQNIPSRIILGIFSPSQGAPSLHLLHLIFEFCLLLLSLLGAKQHELVSKGLFCSSLVTSHRNDEVSSGDFDLQPDDEAEVSRSKRPRVDRDRSIALLDP